MAAAVIFDMDGLLIDSEPLWVRAEIEVFGAVGLELSEDDCARTKGLRVDDVVAYWQASSPKGFGGVPRAEVESRLIARVATLIAAEGRALAGASSALALARARGPVALASSSPLPVIEAALDRLGMSGSFDVVLSAWSEPYGKPHPGLFLSTAARLGAPAAECLVLEDSLNGVLAAKSARMACVAVPFDHPDHDPRFVIADRIIGSLEALSSEILDELSPACRT